MILLSINIFLRDNHAQDLCPNTISFMAGYSS